MELLQLEHFGKILRLEGSMAGWQQLYWGEQIVSQITASEAAQGKRIHHFEFLKQIDSSIGNIESEVSMDEPVQTKIQCKLEVDVIWQPFKLNYSFHVDEKLVKEASRDAKDIEQQTPVKVVTEPKKLNVMGLGLLALKLFKSVKLIKVVLAGASVAAYSWFFSFQFAASLIACLVFHEYGHIRAMKYFGMKTKGIYLIPFVGGLAVTDEKINTRWQDVVISIMGPTFGLILSLLCMLIYWATDSEFFAGLAAFNALLNLFNMLPILPLDGGHILKSISFSMNSKAGLIACILGALFGVVVSYSLGLALLGFLLIVGSLEIIFEWRTRFNSHLLPLDGYGQLFSTVWYLLTVSGLVGVIFYFASSGDHLLSLPLQILGN
ncbi:site-2 protease family protein [Psychromonas algicola]|uniref:site-2 protease family protein n=1 Tax=Psychromonas algicola TaxID=2555642 RepID=UPI00106812DE|nr:site-2 protease family protein [Psychromonas sp. RZ5]TEW46762.1 site-2 protease family protein [Psychromonas sp. RZ5]